MSCGCKAKTGDLAGVPSQAPSTPRPRTRPDEGCFLCADKHVSSAWLEASTTSRTWFVLGELELARRHLLAADVTLATQAAYALFAAASATEGWRTAVDELAKAVADRLNHGQSEATGKFAAQEKYSSARTVNPLLGVLHLGAACRLARELNYMEENRAMIIGDLVAAAEQLVDADVYTADLIRELRHSVQTAPRADLSGSWMDACARACAILPPWHSDKHSALLPGLRAYLGLPIA